jgi:hypothetical protein
VRQQLEKSEDKGDRRVRASVFSDAETGKLSMIKRVAGE